jgi:hypothetical protein
MQTLCIHEDLAQWTPNKCCLVHTVPFFREKDTQTLCIHEYLAQCTPNKLLFSAYCAIFQRKGHADTMYS